MAMLVITRGYKKCQASNSWNQFWPKRMNHWNLQFVESSFCKANFIGWWTRTSKLDFPKLDNYLKQLTWYIFIYIYKYIYIWWYLIEIAMVSLVPWASHRPPIPWPEASLVPCTSSARSSPTPSCAAGSPRPARRNAPKRRRQWRGEGWWRGGGGWLRPKYSWLVVWNGLEHEFYDFPYIGNVIIPTDELIFFRGVGIPPTSMYIYIDNMYIYI